MSITAADVLWRTTLTSTEVATWYVHVLYYPQTLQTERALDREKIQTFPSQKFSEINVCKSYESEKVREMFND